MAFDIDKMKADGVSSHLIELASMNQETFLLLIARRLEHDKLFQQFMGENAGSIETMYPYAVAAGLMSESDREWLVDEGNPYKPQSGDVWANGASGTEGAIMSNGTITKDEDFTFVQTSYAAWSDIFKNPQNYVVEGKRDDVTLSLEFNGTADDGKWSVESDQVDISVTLDEETITVVVNGGTTSLIITKK